MISLIWVKSATLNQILHANFAKYTHRLFFSSLSLYIIICSLPQIGLYIHLFLFYFFIFIDTFLFSHQAAMYFLINIGSDNLLTKRLFFFCMLYKNDRENYGLEFPRGKDKSRQKKARKYHHHLPHKPPTCHEP